MISPAVVTPLATERRRLATVWTCCLLAFAVAGCGSGDQAASKSGGATEPVFEDMARATGLVFNHDSGATGRFYMPEIMGSGIALLDYDGDDDLDVFVLQGKTLEPGAANAQDNADGKPRHRLFRNELNPSGSLAFTDVSESAGIDDRGYGMGLAVGDIDNDGDPDLYLANFGPNALYINNGDGTFSLAPESGTNDDRFGSSAAFLDYDADGLLDLFVVNYNTAGVSNNQACRGFKGELSYCDPLGYPPAVDRIFRNLGGGKFEDSATETGVFEHFGTGLGVIGADFNADGALDIYVANDKMANIYW
ncbi:MAG: VCBS repeat-containing protein, partial [Gammaproteobacteria bacterium]|nr:VCBS repeat-containing protein [Gammaproteobacteria bacterium]